jgi:RimJ/RimL family protein N-acetyltransferase
VNERFVDLTPVQTARLRLPVLGPLELAVLVDAPQSLEAFRVPVGWPDAHDRSNVERWHALAEDEGASQWRARAIVDGTGAMVGHAGFHGPPVAIDEALADPTFVGSITPCAGGAVELGYSIFTSDRRQGFAAEAAAGLIEWAFGTGSVDAVIATVGVDNDASHRVLASVGGFVDIGGCRDERGDEVVYRRDR